MTMPLNKFLPYPLPPWEHDFRTLAVHCQANEASLSRFIPAPFELASSCIQVAVMRFDCQVPTRLYYDAAIIALVSYKGITGGFWPFSYNSTDQAMSGTREIWGYNMKLSNMEITEKNDRITGTTNRLGKKIISIAMTPTGKAVETVDMFPRLFLKATPDQAHPDGARASVVKMDTRPEPQTHLTGTGEVLFEPSEDDPLHEVKITKVFGATFTTGHQILPWGEDLD